MAVWRLVRHGQRQDPGGGLAPADRERERFLRIWSIVLLTGLTLCLAAMVLDLASWGTSDGALLDATEWLVRVTAVVTGTVAIALFTARPRRLRRIREAKAARETAGWSHATAAFTAALISLPADRFPFTLELVDPATGVTVWSAVADGPRAIQIPSAASLGRARLGVRVTYANGKVEESKALTGT